MSNDALLSTPLGQFLGGYFHQDWTLDHGTWQDVVRNYVRSESPDAVRRAGTQLRSLVTAEIDDPTLERQVHNDYGCFFSPGSIGLGMRQWLKEVLRMLDAPQGGGAA